MMNFLIGMSIIIFVAVFAGGLLATLVAYSDYDKEEVERRRNEN